MKHMPARIERARRISEKLERELGARVFACLADPEVLDIILNPDGFLWVERLGRAPERLGEMPPYQAEALISTIASEMRTVITAEYPILECELPIDGSRFSAVIPPVVSAPCFAIRCRASRIFTLADYVASGVMSRRPGHAPSPRRRGAARHHHRGRHRLGQDDARQCAHRPHGGGLPRGPAGHHRGHHRTAMRRAERDDHAHHAPR